MAERHIMALTTPMNRSITKGLKKLNKVQKWAYVAQAMDLVFSQQDTGDLKFRQMFTHVYLIFIFIFFD